MKWPHLFVLVIAVAVGFVNCRPDGLLQKTPKRSRWNQKNPLAGRIVNGDVAKEGQFPYQMAIQNDWGLFCGGVLLSEHFALTVAHCIDGVFYILAYLGVHNIRERDENWVELVLHRDSCYLHPEWDPEVRANDIALIDFPVIVELTSRVNVVALPRRQERGTDYFGGFATVSGWGYDETDAEGLTPLLHFSKLRITEDPVCSHFYPNIVRDTNVCTDTGLGLGICNGDSGAPLVYQRPDGSIFVLGLGSYIGRMGCGTGWPNVFTRMDRYLDWIGQMTNVTISD